MAEASVSTASAATAADAVAVADGVTGSLRVLKGRCGCGGVKFEVDVPAAGTKEAEFIWGVYCHCEMCRRYHAAPLYQVTWVPRHMFRVTAGDSLVKRHNSGHIIRAFCTECGTRVFNDVELLSSTGGIAFFPSTLSKEDQADFPEAFKPQAHVNAQSSPAFLSVPQLLHDGVPKPDPAEQIDLFVDMFGRELSVGSEASGGSDGDPHAGSPATSDGGSIPPRPSAHPMLAALVEAMKASKPVVTAALADGLSDADAAAKGEAIIQQKMGELMVAAAAAAASVAAASSPPAAVPREATD